jgi:glycosyltransferase involved in cell wall biosynthesis
MRIFGWPADWHGCAFYRIEQPLEALQHRGHDVHVAAVARGDAAEHMMSADTIIAQRTCLPHATARWQCLRQVNNPDYREWLRKSGTSNQDLLKIHAQAARRDRRHHMVLELDDDLWNIAPSSKQAYAFYNNPAVLERLALNVARADTVTCTTQHLAGLLRPLNPNVHVIPNAIPAWLLQHQRPRRMDGVVTVGWAGSGTHAMDWAMCDTPLRAVLGHTRSELHVIGNWSLTWSRLPASKVRTTGWISSVAGYYRAIDFDIGLAPLADHRFNYSKSPIKALEYAALGIPVIASPVGPYRDFVIHGKTGYHARTNAEWTKYLKDLIHDPAQRAELGALAREHAANWTIDQVAPLWERALTP